jgi:hypothetical protein
MATWRVSNIKTRSIVERQIWTNGDEVRIVKEFFYTNGAYLVGTEDENKPQFERKLFLDSGAIVDGVNMKSCGYYSELLSLEGGYTSKVVWPENLSSLERQALISTWEDDGDEDGELTGWRIDYTEVWFLNELKIDLIQQEHEMSKDTEITSQGSQEKDFAFPPVIPMFQSAQQKDGSVIIKRLKPLNYSLLEWVKNFLKKPDTVEISEDEDSGQFNLPVRVDSGYEYECFFETDEKNGLIRFYIYATNISIQEGQIEEIKNLINEMNLSCYVGQMQLINKSTPQLRYYNAVLLKGVASEDPEYKGEFQISPLIYRNMFEFGLDFTNLFISKLTQFLDVGPLGEDTQESEYKNLELSVRKIFENGGTKAKVAELIYNSMIGAERRDVIDMFVQLGNLTPSGASTYYANIKAKNK